MSPISTSTRPYFLEVIVPKDLIFKRKSQNRGFSNNIRINQDTVLEEGEGEEG